MSESRLLYNHVVDSLKDKQVRDMIRTYVTELEQQLTELKESQKQKQIIRLCQRLDKAEQQNKYLTEQNKAFQEEYNTSGDIIRELRQQNKELVASFDDFIREINSLCYKSQSPLMNNSHQIDTKYLRKRCLNLHSSLNKHR